MEGISPEEQRLIHTALQKMYRNIQQVDGGTK